MKIKKYSNYLLVLIISFIFNALLINVDIQIIPDARAWHLRMAMTLISLAGIILFPFSVRKRIYYNISVFLFTSSLCILVGLLDVISFSNQNNYYNGIIQYMLLALILNPDVPFHYLTMTFSILPYVVFINYLFPGLKQTFPITTGILIFGFLYAVVSNRISTLQNNLFKNSEEKTNILESINEAFLSIDNNKKLIYINEKARKLARITKHTLKTKDKATVDELFPKLISTDLYNKVIDCIENGNSYNYNQFFPTIKKSFSIRISHFKSVTSLYMLDITDIEYEKKTMESHLNKKINSIRRMIHDIKSPLQGINFNAHFISKMNKEIHSEKLDKYVFRIQESSKIINELTNELNEPIQDNTDYTPIKKMIYQIFDIVQNNMVSFTYNEIPPVYVFGSSTRFYKAVSNIVNNAIKYNTDNLIQFHMEAKDGKFFLSVSNNSNLLDIDDRIFNEFHRMANVREAEGSGLGLAICKEIMSQLKGNVNYRLEGNKITFTLEFKIIEPPVKENEPFAS